MRALITGKSAATIGAAALMVFGSSACATKKYVRNSVSPVESRTATLEKKTSDHSSAISEIENNVSRTDEKATEANKNAMAAGQSADRANQAALEARNRADSANTAAERAGSRANEIAENIDNYQLVTTEAVLFPVNKSNLTTEGKAQLDQAVAQIKNNKNFVLEIRGFTDRTGSMNSNLVLGQKRADAVVRYLSAHNDIPLRKIHVMGVGVEENARDTQKTRAARKEARRVEVKVYALDLNKVGGNTSAAMTPSTTGATTPTTTGASTMTNVSTPTATGTSTPTSNDQMRARTEPSSTSR